MSDLFDEVLGSIRKAHTSINKNIIDRLLVCVLRVRTCALLEELQDLVDLGREQVEGRKDATVRTEVVLLHDFLVVNRVSNVNIALEGHVEYSWIEVYDVGRISLAVKVGVDALHEGRLARSSHADADDRDGL